MNLVYPRIQVGPGRRSVLGNPLRTVGILHLGDHALDIDEPQRDLRAVRGRIGPLDRFLLALVRVRVTGCMLAQLRGSTPARFRRKAREVRWSR